MQAGSNAVAVDAAKTQILKLFVYILNCFCGILSGMPAPTLHTKRLCLRYWREEDLSLFAAMNRDPKVMEFFPSLLTREQSDALVEKIKKELEEKPYGLWAVEVVGIAPFIGFVGLHDVPFEAHFTPATEIGWRLAHAHWGRGYAYEAAKEVLAYAFEQLELKGLVSFTAQTNFRSIGLMKKLGMHNNPKENFEHPKLAPGDPLRPHVLFRLNFS
jgi:RimJ/RimL family protein N-acetyltransferase